MAFCFYTTLAYFSPLLQSGFGVGVGAIAVIGVIRSYVFQFVAGPVGGIVVDKVTHSTPRFLGWMFAVSAVLAAAFVILPKSPALVGVALALLLVLCLAVFMSRGVYWATVGELGVPTEQRGGVIGLASGHRLPARRVPARPVRLVDRRPAAGVPEQGGGYTSLFGLPRRRRPRRVRPHGRRHAAPRRPTRGRARPRLTADPSSPSKGPMDIREFSLDHFSPRRPRPPSSPVATPGSGEAFSLALAKAGADVFVPAIVDDDGTTRDLVEAEGCATSSSRSTSPRPGPPARRRHLRRALRSASTSSSIRPASAGSPRSTSSVATSGTR